ncbi:hypothetical protein GGR14_003298 [Butyricimonas faecihominis]|uniref:Uncharacterized protein n=1 Tax=Butyricimonas faecihominis TaxID=1472416 RepID=A0A7W6MZY5_9BACT|nr:hypothetical protein [Butyricimonas faecihominis]
MRSACSRKYLPLTEISSGSPGPAPTISMNPRRSTVRFMATAKVKSLPSLSLPFCFSRSRRVFPVDFRAAASATLGEEVTSRTFSEGLGTEMFRSSSGEYESIESIKL